MNNQAIDDKQKILKLKRARLTLRAEIMTAIRRYFTQNEFLEVETPIRIQAPAPELNIDTEPCGDHFLIASPELQMKQMVAAGYERIFQITKCFRRGERGDHHLPEFTMLEWYETAGTLETLKQTCRGILETAAIAAGTWPTLSFKDSQIALDTDWHSLEVQDAFVRFAGWRPGAHPDPFKFDLDLVDKVEPSLPMDAPVFLAGYPASMASLARIDPHNAERALRMELYAGGLELANGFEELTDPHIQRQRFIDEENERRLAGKSPYPLDNDFLAALNNGMPPCAGMAMGIDRLVMILTNAQKISDIVPFA